MSSALNKVMGFLGLVDSDESHEVVESPTEKKTTRDLTSRSSERTGVTVVGSRTALVQPQSTAVEENNAYNIITLQPRSYSEARKVGEYYREGNPVIINLDDMEESERKRLVDFSSGLVF
jgi:cell division inhibitor SepF